MLSDGESSRNDGARVVAGDNAQADTESQHNTSWTSRLCIKICREPTPGKGL